MIGNNILNRKCSVCGKSIQHLHEKRVYCSARCQKRAFYLRHKGEKNAIRGGTDTKMEGVLRAHLMDNYSGDFPIRTMGNM